MSFNTDAGQQAMSEINVTPLVDVMLVLLVIFIVTAPLLMQAVRVNLPKTDTAPPLTKNALIHLTIDAHGQYFVDRKPVPPQVLGSELKHRKTGDDTSVQIDADEAVPYRSVAQALTIVNNAGIHRLSFVTVHD